VAACDWLARRGRGRWWHAIGWCAEVVVGGGMRLAGAPRSLSPVDVCRFDLDPGLTLRRDVTDLLR